MEFNIMILRIVNSCKVRFENTIFNLREVLSDFMFDPKVPHKGLEMFESHFVNNYLMASQSLSHYVCGTKTSTKRILFAWLVNLSLWIIFIKYLLIYMIKDQWIFMFFGDPLYLFERSDLLALTISVNSLALALTGRIFFIIYSIFIEKNNYSL